MRWSVVMNLRYIQGEELSRSTKSSLTWVINKALYVFALYPVFTGGGIFLDTLVVSQTQPWRPKSICVVLRFNVLLREPLILLSLSASSLQLVHFCLWQRENSIAMETKPASTDMDTAGLQPVRTIHRWQSPECIQGQSSDYMNKHPAVYNLCCRPIYACINFTVIALLEKVIWPKSLK